MSSFAIKVEGGSPDATRIQAVVAAAQVGLSPPITLGPGAQSILAPATYPFNATRVWSPQDPVTLPYGPMPAGSPTLRIWTFAPSLADLPGPAPYARLPRFAVRVGTYNQATGQMDKATVTARAWGTLVGVTIKKTPPIANSPSTALNYEIVGAGERDIVVLERLLAALDAAPDPGFIASITWLYPSGGALTSIGLSHTAMCVTQVNLTTVTSPPTLLARMARAADEGTYRTEGCFNTPDELVRLVWEASITRSGGFYLYHADTTTNTGLPDGIFDDKGEATLSLLIQYYNPGDGAPALQDRVGGYMNVAVTGDYIDPSQSAVFAEASAPAVEAQPGQGGVPTSLADIAALYYMDPIALAEDNATAALATGVAIAVNAGVYEVGVAKPGAVLADIAAWFGITSQAIIAQNPQIDWSHPSSPLPLYTAVLLPASTVTVGTSPGGNTLASLAAYYGAQAGRLAADNVSVRGLFASSAVLTVNPGPTTRTAAVQPGVVPAMASRPVPPDVPADPKDPSYGNLYLQHAYSLLGYSVASNAWFDASNMGLPMGPQGGSPDQAPLPDKRPLSGAALTGDWEYQQCVPFPAFWKAAPGAAASPLPDPTKSPYLGIGGILQLSFGLQDPFGNMLVSSLSNPSLFPGSTLNQPPWYVGYTDALVSLSQWPGVSSHYRVYTSNGARRLEIELSFDPSRFDPSQGSPAEDPSGTPTWQAAAQQAIATYRKLYYQLADTRASGPAVSLSVTSSVLAAGAAAVSEDQRSSLWSWLFGYDPSGATQSIYTFLAARAQGDTAPPDPTAPTLALSFDLSVTSPPPPGAYAVNQAQLFELATAFVMSRPVDLVAADLRTTPAVSLASSDVPPDMTASDTGSLTLQAFASDLEAALLVPGSSLVKVAVGVDRRDAGAQVGSPVWLVRFGLAAGGGITYAAQNPTAPILFAPRPIYNTLQTREDVAIYNYVQGKGLSPTVSYQRTFTGVDVDAWAKVLLQAVDDFLSPALVTPARLVGHHFGDADYISPILKIKTDLAGTLSQLVIPVLAEQTATAEQQSEAEEAYRQALLVQLSSAYTTEAVIQIPFTVSASIDDPGGSAPPRLYGGLAQASPPPGTTLSSPKLALQDASADHAALLTFLLGATSGAAGTQANPLARYVTLDMSYAPTNIEHQIGSLPGIDGYEASTWLSFVVPIDGAANPSLFPALGPFDVPLVLRAFPTPPTLSSQSGLASASSVGPNLEDATSWDYAFVYDEPYHYGQDYTYFTVELNRKQPGLGALGAAPDPVPAMAEFITVYPDVQKDLIGILATIDGTTTDAQTFIDAQAVIGAFTQLIGDVSSSWAAYAAAQGEARRRRAAVGGTPPSQYDFHVTEQAVQQDGKDALMVWIHGQAPPGISTPVVSIDGYTSVPYAVSEGYGYIFQTKDGTLLDPGTGAAIKDRTITLPRLDILSIQDAWSSGYIQRNKYLMPDPTIETAEPFVYQTPQVKFGGPLFPTLDWGQTIAVQTIGTPPVRSLAEHLSALFTALFQDDPMPSQTIQMEVRYELAVNAALAPQSVAVFLLPPTSLKLPYDYQIPSGGCGAGGEGPLVCSLAGAIEAWFQARLPSGAGGTLIFDLTVWSDLTALPSPLLRLRDLELELTFISPPLPTRGGQVGRAV